MDAKFKCEFDQIERVPHDLIGKKPSVLGQQLHATFHHLAIVDFVDWANHSLKDEEEALKLCVIKSAASFKTEAKAFHHANNGFELWLVLLDMLTQHHAKNTL